VWIKKYGRDCVVVVVDTRSRAIEELYRRRYLAFRNGLTPMVGGQEAARDVVQEAFTRALRGRRGYRGEGSLEAWVWKIAMRVVIESRRKHVNTVSLDEVAAAVEFPSPERDLALALAVQRLSPRRRLMVFLRYFADLSYHDIANIVGISEGTVAASLSEARATLRETLEREGVTR
jgi:RNA polymerase sigma factor (sigma-70 family)